MARLYRFGESFDKRVFSGCSCAFGVFDGYHVGHRLVVDSARESARREGGDAVVLTFDVDPDELFRAQELKKLMSNEARIGALLDSGADAVVVLPFTREFASLSPDDFLELVFGANAPLSLHVGEDFRFGSRASGTVCDLARWAEGTGTEVCARPLKELDGAPVTSTRIRRALANCDVKEASRLLGRLFSIVAPVVEGRREGAEMGFATANLAIPAQLRVLGEGVYAGYATVDGMRYKAAVSMGASPTFADATSPCEVHLLDFEGDLYGRELAVELAEFLRPMIKFDSVDELVATVTGNIQWCRDNL